jgi:hypothetical protein
MEAGEGDEHAHLLAYRSDLIPRDGQFLPDRCRPRQGACGALESFVGRKVPVRAFCLSLGEIKSQVLLRRKWLNNTWTRGVKSAAVAESLPAKVKMTGIVQNSRLRLTRNLLANNSS